jgi:hypothetical protein
MLKEIQCLENSPVLSRNFESSVSGLYFVGTAAANSFGPLMRFAFGADFTSKRLSRYLSRRARKKMLSKDSAKRAVRVENPVESNKVLS